MDFYHVKVLSHLLLKPYFTNEANAWLSAVINYRTEVFMCKLCGNDISSINALIFFFEIIQKTYIERDCMNDGNDPSFCVNYKQ